MKLKFLGTAAAEGWPGIFCHCKDCDEARKHGGKNIRTRAQVLVNEDLLMDLGPDTYMHSILYQVDMARIETVLITHSHSDHFYPQELVLRSEPYAYNEKDQVLLLMGNEKCKNMLQNTEYFDMKYMEESNCVKYNVVTPGQQIKIKDYEIIPFGAQHDDSEECMIYGVKDKSRKRLLYANDTGFFPEKTWKALEGLHFDVVTMDCTMGTQEGYYGHMSFANNVEVKRRMLEMGCADENTVFISTHFAHTCCPMYEEFEILAAEHNIKIAYDGMEIEII